MIPASSSAGMDATELLRQRNMTAAKRWRLIFGALALVVPLGLFALFHRQENRLRALVDHGQVTTATVTGVTRQGSSAFSEYRYEVGGRPFDWSVSQKDAPYAPGQTFAVTYLPEDPSLSRPGEAYTQARFDADVDLTFQHRLLAFLSGFFVLSAVWCEVTLRRLRAGTPLQTRPRLTPAGAGRLVAGLLLAVTLGVNLDPKVVTVQAAAFGQAPLGLPLTLVICVVQIVLFAPFFWVFPQLMRIVMDAQAKGASLSRFGILVAVLRVGPEHRRARLVVLGGFAYFVVLVAAWIAFAASRGV